MTDQQHTLLTRDEWTNFIISTNDDLVGEMAEAILELAAYPTLNHEDVLESVTEKLRLIGSKHD